MFKTSASLFWPDLFRDSYMMITKSMSPSATRCSDPIIYLNLRFSETHFYTCIQSLWGTPNHIQIQMKRDHNFYNYFEQIEGVRAVSLKNSFSTLLLDHPNTAAATLMLGLPWPHLKWSLRLLMHGASLYLMQLSSAQINSHLQE